MAVRSPQDIYARHVSSSRGYPMWTPEPSTQLLSCRPEGIKIGDVGAVVPDNGSFDVFFNLCLPKDHPFHKSTGVPDSFEPIELSDADIKSIPDGESPGQVLTTCSVRRVGAGDAIGDGAPVMSELPISRQADAATRYSFKMSPKEGAALILPEGAECHDVRDPRPFFEQASRHAATWYLFAEQKLGRLISHDAIYVVTGFHKARSWGLAGYRNEWRQDDFEAHFIVGAPRKDGRLATGYSWETTRKMDWHIGSLSGPDIPNQAVFIRGFKISLRSGVQNAPQRSIGFQAGGRYDRQTSSGDSWLSNVWRGISKGIGVSSEGGAPQTGMSIEISRFPEILPVFHPSDVINRYILQKEPSAKVAITHDSDWGSILDKNLNREELALGKLLTKALSERYDVVSRDGVGYLQRKSGFDDISPDSVRDDSPTPKAEDKNFGHSESLSIVSESNYRCIDASPAESSVPESRPADLHSISSEFLAASEPVSPENFRPIKIVVISDYICGFCYICDKILRDAIDACRELRVRFDVEFRPFTLLNSNPTTNPGEVVYRNAYVMKKFGKEQTELKLKALNEFAQKAGLTVAEDSIVCGTLHAHRLSAKAYRVGGTALQDRFNAFVFDACLAKGANISEEDVLVDAAVKTGLMNKEEATQFLRSTEYQDNVEKMVEAARSQGISGVPFVIIDNKWAVNGLQPKEFFIQIFRKLAQLPAPSAVSRKPRTEEGVGVH